MDKPKITVGCNGSSEISRRDTLKLSLGTVVAGSVLGSTQAASAADSKPRQKLKDESSGMPYGMIGEHKVGRLIMGSNPPGSHSRDLIYAPALGAAYCTPAKMLDTYELAESQGINTVLQGGYLVNKYNAERGGKLKVIQPVTVTPNSNKDSIRKMLIGAKKNKTASMSYIWGDMGDKLVLAKRIDLVGTAMELAKELGVTLGIGGHSLQVPIECDKAGIKPDFYVKTFHHDKYWSATPKENREDFCWYDGKGGNSLSGHTGDHDRFHDNIWCLDAEKTIEVMNKIDVPWIAFKVLAAGAISPSSGFKFAFHNGADFVAVGMPDFYIRKNTQVTKGLFARKIKRIRPWA